jgi:hypothetical protein
MAQRVRVSCINKTDRTDPHQRIASIGGSNPDESAWKLWESAAIDGTESGKWSFFVERPPGHAVDVVVATRLGVKYLKTTADGEQPDNLLALPECP